jgi:alkylation response protein AidB-like acyl-CoA dehydrogenase
MASNFIQSTREHRFILKEWLDMDKVFACDKFKDSYGMEDIDFILDNALSIAREVIAPTNDDGDTQHAVFENGKVTVPESFKDAYFFIQENGLGSSNKDLNDESALPMSILACSNEYMMGANGAFCPYFLATSGSAGLIQSFGSQELKDLFLPKMFSGQWSGTMDLTEPIGGSDVGELLTKAYPTDKPGVYKIKGSKCFITAGEQDITENIVHLTLARIEGAKKGTRGISLFVVPKFWPDANGEVGEFNDVTCGGIEHKLGLRGSATAIVNFGEENNCLGYLLGDPPDAEGNASGMAQMFHMMNEERMVTGHASLAGATVAYNNAVEYAQQRIQGKLLSNPKGDRVPIIKHEDVRRMLMYQKSIIEASRAMTIYTYYLTDVAEFSSDEELVAQAKATIEVNTPIVKAFCSDMCFLAISEAMQVYGGYGYSEEYPIAQLLRDSRIYPIWEGTNFIQSMDLVGRKWMMGKGKVFAGWLQNIQDFIDKNKGESNFTREFELLQEHLNNYKEIQMALAGYLGEGKVGMIGLYSTRILHATGRLYGAKLLLDQALIAARQMDALGADHYDYPFYNGKVAAARFFTRNILPEVAVTLGVIKDGDTSAIDIVEEAFSV